MYLKDFREALNLSQKEFSAKLGMTQATIARYETNKMNPTSLVIQKYIDIFDANPNFLFKGIEPKFFTSEDENISNETKNILKDFHCIMTENELNNILKNILINKMLEKFVSDDKSVFEKLLDVLNLDAYCSIRPFLFLYHIFKYVSKNYKDIRNIESYKKYFIDLVMSYNLLSFKNQPIFTNKIKDKIRADIELKFSEYECKLLILNYEKTLTTLESNMPSAVVLSYRNDDINALFE